MITPDKCNHSVSWFHDILNSKFKTNNKEEDYRTHVGEVTDEIRISDKIQGTGAHQNTDQNQTDNCRLVNPGKR